jgi:hypothetical protein
MLLLFTGSCWLNWVRRWLQAPCALTHWFKESVLDAYKHQLLGKWVQGSWGPWPPGAQTLVSWVKEVNRGLSLTTLPHVHGSKHPRVACPTWFVPGLTGALSSLSLHRPPGRCSGCSTGFQCTDCPISNSASGSWIPGLFSHSMWWVTEWIRRLLGHSHWWVLFQLECSRPYSLCMLSVCISVKLEGNSLEPCLLRSFLYSFTSSSSVTSSSMALSVFLTIQNTWRLWAWACPAFEWCVLGCSCLVECELSYSLCNLGSHLGVLPGVHML